MNKNFFAFALGAICLFLLLVGTAQAQEPAKSLLLVASPHLQGAYRETALLVVPTGERYLGLILNRASKATLGDLFPRHAPSAKVVDPVYIGGPEAGRVLFAAVRHNPGDAAIKVADNLWLTGNAPALDRIIETTPNDARFFLGFVSWAEGELESELAQGYWLMGEADAELVFRKDTNGMWEEQLKRLGGGAKPRPGEKTASSAAVP